MTHPPMLKSSSQDGQRSKNQKKSQGTTVPPSVGFGVSTGVVTAMIRAAAEESVEMDAVGAVVAEPVPDKASVAVVDIVPSGVMVVVSPLGRTVWMAVVILVLKVTALWSFEKIVKPAPSVVEMTMPMGSMVVASPFEKVVVIGVLSSVDKVITAPSAFQTTVCPAALTEAPLSHKRTTGSSGELHATACLRWRVVEGD